MKEGFYQPGRPAGQQRAHAYHHISPVGAAQSCQPLPGTPHPTPHPHTHPAPLPTHSAQVAQVAQRVLHSSGMENTYDTWPHIHTPQHMHEAHPRPPEPDPASPCMARPVPRCKAAVHAGAATRSARPAVSTLLPHSTAGTRFAPSAEPRPASIGQRVGQPAPLGRKESLGPRQGKNPSAPPNLGLADLVEVCGGGDPDRLAPPPRVVVQNDP